MKKAIKKTISIILVTALLFSIIPSVFEESLVQAKELDEVIAEEEVKTEEANQEEDNSYLEEKRNGKK